MLARVKQYPYAVHRPVKAPGNVFAAESHEVMARITPMSGTASVQMYGLQPSVMRVLVGAPGIDVLEGDGVCVSCETEPDYKVLYVARWERCTMAHLKYIPPAERGGDE